MNRIASNKLLSNYMQGRSLYNFFKVQKHLNRDDLRSPRQNPSHTFQLEWHALTLPFLFELTQSISESGSHLWELDNSWEANNLIRQMNKKTLSTDSEKCHHVHNSVEIASKNEQKEDLKWLWRHMVATKILTNFKNQDRANNSLNYCFAAIK